MSTVTQLNPPKTSPPKTSSTPPPVKDLYEIGEIPPLGHVPAKMYAWAIRKERHGPPEQSMQIEVRADLADRRATRCWFS